MSQQLKVTLKKSGIGRSAYFTRVLKGMGLTKLNKTVVLPDTPEMRGMVNKVSHMVSLEEC
ncbi:50S ribosomal protein L30 [Desulfuromonas thiophila]|jgi:large subunit ribosomal protein L30|uniref:50S ribosomal protein L30 n=1 Tax=Desulfuromonas thiophila TaxID=57664 RepID=A0A1G6YRE8_9BACT|nr:50S ribosomal protein L30 [Desulfuromonas thiophila]MCK9172108.1 50S ribosomal protein L30 [Desulfuromonas thiophila]MDD3800905.1 50S ribosomal protein L30 [Desulfuromonas thiophila]MDY0397348.1 50S ribosomal protein L30 [Desulfuromonas thiophila]SDD92862.1 LSU ribosomal protein L30P [Desulfuromonas thiophila]